MSISPSERLNTIIDPESFAPYQASCPCQNTIGQATVREQRIWVISTQSQASAPILPTDTIKAQIEFYEHIIQHPAPLISLVDTPAHMKQAAGGTSVPPGADTLQCSSQGVGRTYSLLSELHTILPQLSILYGQVGASLTFPLALSDSVVMLKDAAACIGRPDAVRTMIGQQTDFEHLGGASMHCSLSGLGCFLADHETDAANWVKQWLTLVPPAAGTAPTAAEPREPYADAAALSEVVPHDPNRPFDVLQVIHSIVDGKSLLEIKAQYAPEILTALARVEGQPVGLIANNSSKRGGVVFPETCRKMIHFLSFCDRFSIPVVFLADTPGFMIGEQVEHAGIIQEGARLFSTIATLTTRKLCIVLRRAYTAGLYAMAGPGFSPEQFYAMPTASIAVFGRRAAEVFVANRDLSDAQRKNLQEMIDESEHPELLAAKGLLDRVLDWHELRPAIASFSRGETA